MLTVVKTTTPKKEKKTLLDYAIIHCKAYTRANESYSGDKNKENLYKAIYHGVMYSNYLYKVFDALEKKKPADAPLVFQSMENVKEFIKQVTPNELTRIFPITKRYDGARYQAKDYFTTMESLKEHGLDNPIGEAIALVLWSYTDDRLMEFTLNLMDIVGELHKAQTGRDWFLDFAEEQGTHLTTYTMSTDAQGKQYLTDSDTGKTVRVHKPKPRYLKLIKGGKLNEINI